MPLTALAIKNAKPTDKPRKLADEKGLFLLINPNGSKYWRLKYRIDGKEKLLAIGVYCGPTQYDDSGKAKTDKIQLSLTEARDLAYEARKQIKDGVDPNQAKRQVKQQAIFDAENCFEAVAREWHTRSAARWSADHAARIMRRLEVELFPTLGKRSVNELKTRDLLMALRPIEERGHLDVASRLQQYITAIMRYAVQVGRIDSNPAIDLQGALTVAKSQYRPALPLARLPELMSRIDKFNGRKLTQAALRFTLLTFVRSSELRFMRWNEIDWKRATWTIPGEREAVDGIKHSHRGAKMRTPHVVPLPRQAMAILEEIKLMTGHCEFVFAGDHDPSKPMSENTINKALRNMGYDTTSDICGHGFRTMACSALSESTLWDRDIVERQMSHQERNGVRAPYIHRAEYLIQRKQMMQWWADFLDTLRGGEYVEPVEFAHQNDPTGKFIKAEEGVVEAIVGKNAAL
jgi:integrase